MYANSYTRTYYGGLWDAVSELRDRGGEKRRGKEREKEREKEKERGMLSRLLKAR